MSARVTLLLGMVRGRLPIHSNGDMRGYHRRAQEGDGGVYRETDTGFCEAGEGINHEAKGGGRERRGWGEREKMVCV